MSKGWKWEYADSHGRVCVQCKVYKDFSNYHKLKAGRFGYNTICKDCRKPISTQQYAKVSLEARILQRAKTRAVRKGLEFNLELSDIVIPKACPIFGTSFVYGDNDYAASLDRVDSTKGYIKGNVQVISNKANRIKNNVTTKELEKLLNYMKNFEI